SFSKSRREARLAPLRVISRNPRGHARPPSLRPPERHHLYPRGHGRRAFVPPRGRDPVCGQHRDRSEQGIRSARASRQGGDPGPLLSLHSLRAGSPATSSATTTCTATHPTSSTVISTIS